nr:MAG TPA: hypothetical protein [Caudoviricetes sp.]
MQSPGCDSHYRAMLFPFIYKLTAAGNFTSA